MREYSREIQFPVFRKSGITAGQAMFPWMVIFVLAITAYVASCGPKIVATPPSIIQRTNVTPAATSAPSPAPAVAKVAASNATAEQQAAAIEQQLADATGATWDTVKGAIVKAFAALRQVLAVTTTEAATATKAVAAKDVENAQNIQRAKDLEKLVASQQESIAAGVKTIAEMKTAAAKLAEQEKNSAPMRAWLNLIGGIAIAAGIGGLIGSFWLSVLRGPALAVLVFGLVASTVAAFLHTIQLIILGVLIAGMAAGVAALCVWLYQQYKAKAKVTAAGVSIVDSVDVAIEKMTPEAVAAFKKTLADWQTPEAKALVNAAQLKPSPVQGK